MICYLFERLFVSNFTVKTRKYYFRTHRICMETTMLSATFDTKYQNRLTNDLIMADYYIHLWGANNRVSSHKSVVDPHAEESYTYGHDIFSASRARDIVIRIKTNTAGYFSRAFYPTRYRRRFMLHKHEPKI